MEAPKNAFTRRNLRRIIYAGILVIIVTSLGLNIPFVCVSTYLSPGSSKALYVLCGASDGIMLSAIALTGWVVCWLPVLGIISLAAWYRHKKAKYEIIKDRGEKSDAV